MCRHEKHRGDPVVNDYSVLYTLKGQRYTWWSYLFLVLGLLFGFRSWQFELEYTKISNGQLNRQPGHHSQSQVFDQRRVRPAPKPRYPLQSCGKLG